MKKLTIDGKMILDRLEKGIPLFEKMPKTKSNELEMVCGIECELEGPVNRHDIGQDTDESMNGPCPKSCHRLKQEDGNRWLSNGGRMYFDMNSILEFCTPEACNALEAVVYRSAMRRIVARDFQDDGNWLWFDTSSPYQLHNITDAEAIPSLGNHESYLVDSSKICEEDQLLYLAPFLVARILITGCGYVNKTGSFELSPRALVIEKLSSVDTSVDRPLINIRELKSNRKNPYLDRRFERVHLVCGESNPNQITLFLKLMFTSLVIKLLERGKLPYIEYDKLSIISDLKRISSSSSRWLDEGIPATAESWYLKMNSIMDGPTSALDLLDLHAKAIEDNFGGRNVLVDTFLVIIKDTLARLRFPRENIIPLGMRLDAWTKLNMFDACWNADTDEKFERWKEDCRAYDLEYHKLGSRGFINYLERKGLSGRLVTNKMIEWAMYNPPEATRASFRGMLVDWLNSPDNTEFYIPSRTHDSWDSFTIMKVGDPSPIDFRIPDPLDPYDDLKEEVRRLMRGTG